MVVVTTIKPYVKTARSNYATFNYSDFRRIDDKPALVAHRMYIYGRVAVIWPHFKVRIPYNVGVRAALTRIINTVLVVRYNV